MATLSQTASVTDRVDRDDVRRMPENLSAPIRGFDEVPARFGFRWFIPALAQHRALWRDVVLASLGIQVIGLTTPLFAQVILDKVVVHHTYGTLLAIGLGLTMFLIFNAVMSLLRSYLILHTGNLSTRYLHPR